MGGYVRIILLAGAVLVAGCASGVGTQMPEPPSGAVVWCGAFAYTGTWIKAESSGRAMGVSNPDLVERITDEQAIALAEALGCEGQ